MNRFPYSFFELHTCVLLCSRIFCIDFLHRFRPFFFLRSGNFLKKKLLGGHGIGECIYCTLSSVQFTIYTRTTNNLFTSACRFSVWSLNNFFCIFSPLFVFIWKRITLLSLIVICIFLVHIYVSVNCIYSGTGIKWEVDLVEKGM